jgi:mono/diheme cytochrome c family protein
MALRAVSGCGHRRVTFLFSCLLLLSVFAHGLQAEGDSDSGVPAFSREAAAIFSKRCTACHTYGKGIKVGPDLKGVTERRKHEWLLKFIHASSVVIKSGDPTATALFSQFKQQRMPDWVDLSEKQINDILQYLSIGGPDIKPADERNAATATPRDIENGRDLFYGRRHFSYGAQACVTCHFLAGDGLRGGSLGGDLTQSYARFQDKALTEFLRAPCFRWRTAGPADHYLSTNESFALKSLLRYAGQASAVSGTNPALKTSSSKYAHAGAASVRPVQPGGQQ